MREKLNGETERLRGILSRILGRYLSVADTLKWLDDARLWELLDKDAFCEFYARWDPSTDHRPLPQRMWKHGGGRNAPHTNPDPKLKLPKGVKDIENEIKRLMSRPPFPGRKGKINELKRNMKHIRSRGEDTGEEHSRTGKGYQSPGVHEVEEPEEDV